MHRRVSTWSAAMLAAVFASAAVRPAQAQQVVVSVKSAEALLSDVKYLLSIVGQDAQVAAFDLVLGVVKGVDTTKPISAGIDLPDAPGSEPTVLVAIPVTDPDAVVELLKQWNFKADKGGDNIYTVVNRENKTFYLRFAKGHGWISNVAGKVRSDLLDAAALVPADAGTSVVSSAVHLDRIPDMYKKLFKAGLDQAVEKEREKREGETDAAHQSRLLGSKIARELMGEIVDDGLEFTARLDIDQKQLRHVAYDVSLKAKPGSKLAAKIKAFEDSRSVFAGLANDAAASFFVNLPLTDEIRQVADKLYKEATEDALRKQEDPKGRELTEKFFKGVAAAVAADSVDGAAVVRGPLADGKYVLLGALKVKDGKAFDRTLRELVQEVGPHLPLQISLDLDKAGDAVVHQFHPVDEPDLTTKHFIGTKDVFVAVKPEVILVAVGSNGRAVIKEALESAGKAAPLIAPSIQAEISVVKVLPGLSFMNPSRAAAVIEKHFSGDDKGKDRLRATLRGGQSLQLRVEVNAAAIRALIALQRND